MYLKEERYGTDTYPVLHFENVYEITNLLEKEYDNIKKYSILKEIEDEKGFYGTNCIEDSIKRLKYGNQKITQDYLDNIKELKRDNGEINDDFFMDIQGFAYDMGAVVAGEPECCLNQGAPKNKPYLKIYIDTGYNGSVSQETINNRGIAIYELINTLYLKGYILDINFIHYEYCYTGKGNIKQAQVYKISTENLVVSQIAFLGSCEFFRAICWLITAMQLKDKKFSGNGQSMPSQSAIKYFEENGLFIPSGYTDSAFNSCSLSEARKLVTEIYNKYTEKQNDCN